MMQAVCDIQPMQRNTSTKVERVSTIENAKKISSDIWSYRGWIIRRWDNNYLNDPEVRGFQYNTYRNSDAYQRSEMTDIARTLKAAKMYIDNCEDVK